MTNLKRQLDADERRFSQIQPGHQAVSTFTVKLILFLHQKGSSVCIRVYPILSAFKYSFQNEKEAAFREEWGTDASFKTTRGEGHRLRASIPSPHQRGV
jgi:hypothetical protein